MLDFVAEGAGGPFVVNTEVRTFLLCFFGGIETDEFGAHSRGVRFAVELGVSVAEGEINLGFFGKSPLRDLQMRKGLRGTVGVDVEQANQIVSKRKLRT